MRRRILLPRGSVLMAALLVSAFGQSGGGRKVVYFLQDDVHTQWCGYSSETAFKAQVQPLRAMIVGKVDYTDSRPSTIQVTETDETGDWAVNDEYALDASGRVQALKRTINILPEDMSEQQAFVIRDGKADLQRSTYRELRSGKPTEKRVSWFEPPPVVTSVHAFPFSALITGKQQAVWASGRACVPGAGK